MITEYQFSNPGKAFGVQTTYSIIVFDSSEQMILYYEAEYTKF